MTVLAEKFQAVDALDLISNRVKDFLRSLGNSQDS